MIRRPPRSTLDRSSAASDVYKRQLVQFADVGLADRAMQAAVEHDQGEALGFLRGEIPVSYTHLRAHETVLDLVCRLLLEKKKHYYESDASTITRVKDTALVLVHRRIIAPKT